MAKMPLLAGLKNIYLAKSLILDMVLAEYEAGSTDSCLRLYADIRTLSLGFQGKAVLS
ncbi:MAG TPA: hypothetical protein PK228_17325 [Saprospiraceae bacterium]|nr:hypothetical protein [Saprospiraceae bacterium]